MRIEMPTNSERHHAMLFAEDNAALISQMEMMLLREMIAAVDSGVRHIIRRPGDDLVHLHMGRVSGQREMYDLGVGPFSTYFEREIVTKSTLFQDGYIDPCADVLRSLVGAEIPAHIIKNIAFDVRAGFCDPTLHDIPDVARESAWGALGKRLRDAVLAHIERTAE